MASGGRPRLWPRQHPAPTDNSDVRPVSNLKSGLKEAVRPTTKKGFSNQNSVYAQAWAETTMDP